MAISRTPSGRWRARIKSGRVDVASRTFDRKRDAEEWEAAQKRSLNTGEYVDPRAARETVASAWERWQVTRQNSKSTTTHNTDRAAFKRLPPSLRNRPVSAVSASAFESLYDALLADLTPGSVSRYRTSYGAFFAWCGRQGLVRGNPALAHKVARGKRAQKSFYPYDAPELLALHAAMVEDVGHQLADVALVLGMTGLRWGELAALRVRDVQRVPRWAFYVSRSKTDGAELRDTTKGGEPRTVPLAPQVVAIVEPLLEADPDALLFGTSTGGFRSGSTWKRDAHFAAHAGGRTVKDLRHSFATNALTAGADVRVVQRWLGHSSATLTLDRYGRWIREDAEDAGMERFAAAFAGGVRGARHEA